MLKIYESIVREA